MVNKSKWNLRFRNICMMLVLVLIILGLGVNIVNATDVNINTGESDVDGSVSGCGSGNCLGKYAAGVRITAVHIDTGERWDNSISYDVWFAQSSTSMEYALYQKYTRQEVLKAVTAGTNLGYTKGSYPSSPVLSEKLPSFSGLGIGKKDFGGADTMIKYIKKEADNGNFKPLQEVVSALNLKHSDGTPMDFVNGRAKIALEIDTLRKLTLQFEPLLAVHNNGNNSGDYKFAGTPTEFAYFNYKYGWPRNGTRGGCNAIANYWLTRGYEGVYAPETQAGLTGTSANASGGCTSDTTPGTFLSTNRASGVAFVNIEDVMPNCDTALQEIIAKYPGSQIKGEAAKKELSDLLSIYPTFILLTDWEEYGKTAPACEPAPEKDCDERLEEILNNYTHRYEELYENNTRCRYYYNGRYYQYRIYLDYRYYSYYYRYYYSNFDRRNGYWYYGTCYVNSYVSSSNKNDIILNWAMSDLQDLYDSELAKGNNFNLLTDWKSFGLDSPKCEYMDKPCIPTNHLSQIDDCYSGYSFFRDDNQEDIWLDCELAFNGRGANYSSDNTGHVEASTEYERTYDLANIGVGNYEYCEVFCTEEVSTKFPTHVKGVRASQTFTWGSTDGVFGNVNIKKKCSNQDYIKGKQGYRFEEWKEDYLANEKALVRHYMKKASYEKMLDKITTSSSGKYTSCWRCSTCTSKSGGTYKCNCRYTCRYRYSGTARASGDSHSWTHNASSNTINVGSVTGSVGSQSSSTGYTYTSPGPAMAQAKSDLESDLRRLAKSEEAAYTGRISQEQELLKKIRQCTSNIKYVYETAIRFVFREPINSTYGANTRNFTYDDFLEVSGSYNENNVNTSKCKWVTAYSYTCSGTKAAARCHATVQMVRDCKVVTWDINGSYTHSYPVADFQWYSLKTDSTLVNEKLKGPEDESFFYYIGFGLPTAFSLTNGTYELKAVVSKLGDSGATQAKKDDPTDGIVQYNTEYGHFWPMANLLSNGDGYGFEYVCTYEVENEIFGYDCRYNSRGQLIYNSPAYCDDDEDDDSDGSLVGIDVAYRLVTLLSDGDNLYKAFPGISGVGRPIGSNWSLPTTTIRTILDADIYNESQAMYEIMLDINAINRIREDNEGYFNSGKDPYTSYYDENNRQKVYCAANGNQKYCASDFVSELYRAVGLNYPLLGTCLPMANTLGRAEYVLANGCDTPYDYPDLNWMR